MLCYAMLCYAMVHFVIIYPPLIINLRRKVMFFSTYCRYIGKWIIELNWIYSNSVHDDDDASESVWACKSIAAAAFSKGVWTFYSFENFAVNSIQIHFPICRAISCTLDVFTASLPFTGGWKQVKKCQNKSIGKYWPSCCRSFWNDEQDLCRIYNCAIYDSRYPSTKRWIGNNSLMRGT